MNAVIGNKQQHLVEQFVTKLRDAAGENLASVLLYGSAAAEDFSQTYSDLNVLCVMRSLDADSLAKLAPALRWWESREQPSAMLFTLDELRHSADVFAIELHDIKARHRLLFGEDPTPIIDVPMKLHRVQLERELRASILKLRQRYMVASEDRVNLAQLMAKSVSTFHTLFRHTLIAMGEDAPWERRAVVDRLEHALGIDAAPLRTVLDLREGKIPARDVAVETVFAGYLRALSAAVDEVDRRLPR